MIQVVRLPQSGRTIELHGGLREPDERHQATQIAVALLQTIDLVDHSPAHQTKIAGVLGNVDIRDTPDHEVRRACNDPPNPRLVLPRAALREYHIEAVSPLRNHLDDQLRRVLQVHVHDDNGVATGVLKAPERSHRLADATAERQQLHARVALAMREDHLFGPVRRRIQREDDLEIRRELLEDRDHPPQELGDVLLFLEDRDNDGEQQSAIVTHRCEKISGCATR
jgi:hypothetical protein